MQKMPKMLTARKKDTVPPIHNSMQIWYEGSDNNSAELSLDMNMWRLDNSKKKMFLDIGLKISDITNIKTLYIYFPFSFEKEQVFDLGATFLDSQTLKGIFNENYVMSCQSDNPKNINILGAASSGEVVFSIYQLSTTDFDVEKNYNGTIVSIYIKPSKKTNTRYYRFRIKPRTFYPCIEYHRPKNSFFESAFIETEFIDFRINEKRNQNPDLIERIVENHSFNLSNVNLFVMTSIEDEVISDGTNLIYKRQLEMGNFWNKYLDSSYTKMSVYKCNNSKKNISGYIDDYSCFAKINYRKSNIFTIVKYLIVLFIITVIFSICANIVSNCIWHYIEPSLGGTDNVYNITNNEE